MSGGVDSAVALLRAGRDAVGVTLRLWLDPEGPERRACVLLAGGRPAGARDVPPARAPARHARPARGVPLARSSAPFVRGYARGRDAESVHPLQRQLPLRRAARVRARAQAATASRRATTRGSSSIAAGACSRAAPIRRRTSRTCSRDSIPRELERIWFPLGEQDKAETRAEAERAGLDAAHRAESQEACFLAGDDYRTFLARHGVEPQPGAIVDESGVTVGEHDGFWRYTPGQRKGLGVVAERPLFVLGADPHANTVRVGPRESLARTHVAAAGSLYVDVERAEAKLRYRSPAVPAGVRAHGRRLRARARRAGVRRRARAGRGALRGRRRRRVRPRLVRPRQLRSVGMLVAAFTWGDLWRLALAVFLLAVGLSFAYLLVRLAGTAGRLSAFIRGAEQEILPVINKVGGSVDRINGQLDKVDQITDSAVDAADSVDTAVRAVSMAVTRPVQKVSGLAAALSYGVSDFKAKHDWKHAVQAGKEAAARREQELGEELRDAGQRAVSDQIQLDAACRGGLPHDRPPRRRRARRPARPDVRGSRRPPGRARGAARLPRRRGRHRRHGRRGRRRGARLGRAVQRAARSTRSSAATRRSGCTACSRRCATRSRSTSATAASWVELTKRTTSPPGPSDAAPRRQDPAPASTTRRATSTRARS